jgi:hypothetical protein
LTNKPRQKQVAQHRIGRRLLYQTAIFDTMMAAPLRLAPIQLWH